MHYGTHYLLWSLKLFTYLMLETFHLFKLRDFRFYNTISFVCLILKSKVLQKKIYGFTLQ